MAEPLKVALVCDWLTEIGGAEQVIKTLHEMFPDAPIYTSQYRHKVDAYFDRGAENSSLVVHTGWLNFLPAASRRFIAPLRQRFFSRLDLTDYDLVISITGCDAKYVKTRPGAHICYCHVPTQYYWGKYEEYLSNPGFGFLNPLARCALKTLAPRLRQNDLKAAAKPDYYVTISSYAAHEIKKYYKRESKVISPPVNVELFQQPVENFWSNREIKAQKSQTEKDISQKLCQTENKIKPEKCQAKKSEQKSCTLSTVVENSENAVRFLRNNRSKYYINFSRQVNWKNLDLILEACLMAKKPLVLVGDGPEHKRLVKLAKKLSNSPDNSGIDSSLDLVLFLPNLPQPELRGLVSGARAFLFPSEEPFGIAPVEALAAGCPVIAYKSGGALDYIKDGKNGLFFSSLKPTAVTRAIKRFEKSPLGRRRKKTISRTASAFSEASFREKMLKYIHEISSNI